MSLWRLCQPFERSKVRPNWTLTMLYIYKHLVNEQLKKSWKIYLLFTVSCNERYQFEQNQNSETRIKDICLDVFNFKRRSRILHACVSTHPHFTYTSNKYRWCALYTKKSFGSVSPRVAWARRRLFFPRSNNNWGQPFWEIAAARSYCSTVTLKLWILYGHAFRTC